MCADEFAEERRRAEVFDALSHPTRIMILKALNENPAGFADLKKQLGIESSGHLQHHISKLNSLVKTDENGKYVLSDEGKDALNSVETVEKVTESGVKKRQKAFTVKTSNVLKLASLALVALLVVSCAVAVIEHNMVASLQAELDERETVLQAEITERDAMISELSNQVDVLNATINNQGKAVRFLNTALQLSNTVYYMSSPVESRYLTTFSEAGHGIPTKIFLVSSTAGYMYSPGYPIAESSLRVIQTDTGNITMPSIGWWAISSEYTTFSGSFGDEPRLLIGVTVRNDYTLEDAENYNGQNSPIGNATSAYHSWSFIKLKIRFYRGDGTVIQTEEITSLNNDRTPNACVDFALKSGETTQVIAYLIPSDLNISHYEIFVEHVADSPQSN